MKRQSLLLEQHKWKQRSMLTICAAVFFCLASPALAADPLTIVNNLSEFVFSCIKAIGVIILGWGIVQVGISVQSHDASQRTQGFLCLFGGLQFRLAFAVMHQ